MYPHQGVYYDAQYAAPHGYYANDMAPPVTPLDLSYSQSMLPSNLLVSSPYIQQSQNMVPMSPILPRQYVPPSLNLSHGNLAHHQQQLQKMHHHHHTHYMSQSPYLTPFSSKSNLEQLNLSRTVILKNIDENVSLNELLNSIDFGPIEYCKMYSRLTPEHLRDAGSLKTCVISFVNSKISINFHIKYSKNRYYLNKLKEKLRNSKYLKISLNDSTNSSSSGGNSANFNNHLNKQDYIKLKTLNYVLEFNATRCLLIRLHTTNFDSLNLENLENDVTGQCAKFGEIEDFKISANKTKAEVKCLIHFTSIDAAIKTYEFHLKKIQADKQNQIEQEGGENSQGNIEYVQAAFHKDRCDKTVIDKPSSGSGTDSSVLPRRQTANNQNNVTPKDLNEPTPDTDGENIEGYEEETSVLNDQSILENNESIRNSLLSNPKDPQAYDQISSKSSSSQNVDQNNISNTSSYMLNSYPSMNQSQIRMQMPHVGANNSTSSYQYNPDPFNVGNRTIYLGNLHPNTTVEEIANNIRAGGLVESIRYHADKRVCFITFIDPTIALKFYLNHQVLHELIIHGYDITVGWAKNHSGALNRDISLAVTAGASRNVYIGIKLNKDETDGLSSSSTKDGKIRLPNECILRSDFSKFGELEQINFYHNKDCGFLNFINIVDAIKLVELFESRNVAKINKIVGDNGEFYDKYRIFKISFAKDRCGNPPKFSFKKKLGKKQNKSPAKPKDNSIISKSDQQEDEHEEGIEQGHEEVMNEEAAMVFGIISTDESKRDIKKSTNNRKAEDIEPSNVNINRDTREENNKSHKFESIQTNRNDIEGEVDEDGDDDDVDDDDDISIIIGSDETASSTNQNRDDLRKLRNDGHKFYDNKVNTSDTFIPYKKSSRNSSNISLNSHNSNYMKYYNNHESKFPPSPYHHQQQQQQQQHYYMQKPQRPVTNRMNSFSYGGYLPPSNRNPNQYTYTANPSKNPYSTSGSQVMSQYLAKSQHDSLLYAASILSNDVSVDEDKEYHTKHSTRRNSGK